MSEILERSELDIVMSRLLKEIAKIENSIEELVEVKKALEEELANVLDEMLDDNEDLLQ